MLVGMGKYLSAKITVIVTYYDSAEGKKVSYSDTTEMQCRTSHYRPIIFPPRTLHM